MKDLYLFRDKLAALSTCQVVAVVAMCSFVGIANAPANAQTELVSVNIGGTGSGNNRSNFPLTSADGGLVVFLSQANRPHQHPLFPETLRPLFVILFDLRTLRNDLGFVEVFHAHRSWFSCGCFRK